MTTRTGSARPSGRTRAAVAAALSGLLALAIVATAPPSPADTESGSDSDSDSDSARERPTRRVDRRPPTFSDPTNITNPLFPITAVEQAVQLGAEGDVALRHEITLLDQTRVIRWGGRDIEAVVSQFLAYGDGELLEVATDFFAQADDGSVWYLGEDVSNYEEGQVVDHEGTWLAGRDGPGGMMMPADPRVGDVYLPENIPGLVFEEVTVKQTGLTVDGPTGPVPGAIQVQERLLDGTLEDKVFAPGYGEFSANVPSAGELVTVAVAVPVDSAATPKPAALDLLSGAARELSVTATTARWSRVAALARATERTWDALSDGAVPPLVDDEIDGAVEAVDEAVDERSREEIQQGAIDLALAALDLEMQYVAVAEVDGDRIEVWRTQLAAHEAADEDAAVASDLAIIAAIEARLVG